MPNYDTREAVAVLGRARGAMYPHSFFAARAKAALELRAAVIDAARRAGFAVVTDATGQEVIQPNESASAVVWLEASHDGIRIGISDNGQRFAVSSAPLEFDAGRGMWVGVEEDHYLSPIPGEPILRRSAVAVVADAIVTAMSGKA